MKTRRLRLKTIRRSHVKEKKWDAVFERNGREVVTPFGQKGYSDFTKHKNRKRRADYLNRSGGIRNKSGELTKNDKFSANYWARRILW